MQHTDNLPGMHAGRIEQHDPPSELSDPPDNAHVLAVLGPGATLNVTLAVPHAPMLPADPRHAAPAAQAAIPHPQASAGGRTGVNHHTTP